MAVLERSDGLISRCPAKVGLACPALRLNFARTFENLCKASEKIQNGNNRLLMIGFGEDDRFVLPIRLQAKLISSGGGRAILDGCPPFSEHNSMAAFRTPVQSYY